MKVSVIVPNWNGKHLLDTCFASLERQTYRDFEVIMVDSGSTDGSVDYSIQNYPWVHVIRLFQNYGFSYAVNRGIERSTGELVALLNNDTAVDLRWLEELVKVLELNPDIGFCASKVLNFYEHCLIDTVGDTYTKCGVPYKIGLGEIDIGQYDTFREVLAACAGAAIYRKSMLKDIGLFDEDFFAYGEDMDLSLRAQLKGYRCLYVPTAIVYHIGSATSGEESNWVVTCTRRNSVNILVKDIPTVLLIKWLPHIIVAQTLISLFKYFFRGQRRAILKAYIDVAKQLPLVLSKRKKIQSERRVSWRYIETIVDTRSLLRIALDRWHRYRQKARLLDHKSY